MTRVSPDDYWVVCAVLNWANVLKKTSHVSETTVVFVTLGAVSLEWSRDHDYEVWAAQLVFEWTNYVQSLIPARYVSVYS